METDLRGCRGPLAVLLLRRRVLASACSASIARALSCWRRLCGNCFSWFIVDAIQGAISNRRIWDKDEGFREEGTRNKKLGAIYKLRPDTRVTPFHQKPLQLRCTCTTDLVCYMPVRSARWWPQATVRRLYFVLDKRVDKKCQKGQRWQLYSINTNSTTHVIFYIIIRIDFRLLKLDVSFHFSAISIPNMCHNVS